MTKRHHKDYILRLVHLNSGICTQALFGDVLLKFGVNSPDCNHEGQRGTKRKCSCDNKSWIRQVEYFVSMFYHDVHFFFDWLFVTLA